MFKNKKIQMGYKYKTLEEAAAINNQKAKQYYQINKESIIAKHKQINDFLKEQGQKTAQQLYYQKNKDKILQKCKERYQQQKQSQNKVR